MVRHFTILQNREAIALREIRLAAWKSRVHRVRRPSRNFSRNDPCLFLVRIGYRVLRRFRCRRVLRRVGRTTIRDAVHG
jgi:hypothetical protein